MCNLYTYKMSREEMRSLKVHFTLIGRRWADIFEKRMEGRNDEALVYPKYQAPVVIARDGERELADMGWGMPEPVHPLKPGEKPKRPAFRTNARNLHLGMWKQWVAHTNVTVGKDKLQGG